MYDITVYALHQLTSVLGPARRVAAMSGIRGHENGRSSRRRSSTEADDTHCPTPRLRRQSLRRDARHRRRWPLRAVRRQASTSARAARSMVCSLNGEPYEFAGREQTIDRPDHRLGGPDARPATCDGPHRSKSPNPMSSKTSCNSSNGFSDGVPTAVTAEHARHVIDIIESGYRAADTGVAQEIARAFDFPPADAFRSSP